MYPMTKSVSHPPPHRIDRTFGAVEKLVQSYFGPDRSNGKQVDGQRPVASKDWDGIVAAAKRDGGIGGREFGLMFNALSSMVGGKRIPAPEGTRVLAQIAPALDGMKRWPANEQLQVLKQLELNGRISNSLGAGTMPVSARPFAVNVSKATAAADSAATLARFVPDYNSVNPRPLSPGGLVRSAPAVKVEQVRLGDRVVGQVINTWTRVTDPSLGQVGIIRSTTYLGPDGRQLSFEVSCSPERPESVDIFQ